MKKASFHTPDVLIENAAGVVFRFPVSRHILSLESFSARRSQRRRLFASVILTTTMCVASFGSVLGAQNGTVAYFRDTDSSFANVFSAGLLGFTVESRGTGYTFNGPEDASGEYYYSNIILASSSIPTQFKLTFEQTGGNADLCNALHAVATTSPIQYDGALKSFSTTTQAHGPFDFFVTLNSAAGLVSGDQCMLDAVYFAWSDAQQVPFGYFDEVRVPLVYTYLEPEPLVPAVLQIQSAFVETPPVEGAGLQETETGTSGEIPAQESTEENHPPVEENIPADEPPAKETLDPEEQHGEEPTTELPASETPQTPAPTAEASAELQ